MSHGFEPLETLLQKLHVSACTKFRGHVSTFSNINATRVNAKFIPDTSVEFQHAPVTGVPECPMAWNDI